ncbi:MAG: sigma-54 dependent transcriptional regulator [Candidatus Latescibacterota bacterium]
MARKSVILALTRRAAVEEELSAALEGDRYHVVPVREAGVLGPLLGRGAALVVVDLALPAEILQEAGRAARQFEAVPVLAVAEAGIDAGGRWEGESRSGPLDEQVRRPAPAETLQRQVDNLLAKAAFLAGSDLVGTSTSMRELRESILHIAPTPISSVLISGESGAGKDVVARALHRFSQRRDHPFVPINCVGIPENLLESELFGHEKGAFTDAKAQRRGLFEQANGGTVFLDEIGEMSPSAQTRLLRVLEQREVTRVGGSAAIPVDIRVIAATNLDLQAAVAQREFRLDLYHRLKVVQLQIPPLRRRPEDIPLLIGVFAAQFGQEGGSHFEGFSPAAMRLLQDYDWPGNVRELRNLMNHLVFLGPRRLVEPGDLLPHLERPPVVASHLPVATNKTPDQSERELIYYALLDLRRELGELRRLVEESLVRPVRPPPTPVYQLEEARTSPVEGDAEVAPVRSVEPVRTLKELEREAIGEALRRVGGSRKQVAEVLGISPRTLYRKLDEYGLK